MTTRPKLTAQQHNEVRVMLLLDCLAVPRPGGGYHEWLEVSELGVLNIAPTHLGRILHKLSTSDPPMVRIRPRSTKPGGEHRPVGYRPTQAARELLASQRAAYRTNTSGSSGATPGGEG